MDFDIRSNVREVERGLSDFGRRQLPFVIALAINWTAKDVKRNAEKALRRKLDRPTPFTRRAFAIRPASKRRLVASIFVKDAQAEYLIYAEEGGSRTPKGQAIVVPVGQRTNKHGNIPRGAIKRALAKPNVFSGTPKGGNRPGGIYKRTRNGRGLTMLIDYVQRAIYRPRLGFKRGAQKTAAARFLGHFYRAFEQAIRTAKR